MDFAPNEILLPIAVAPNYFALKFFSALARASLLLASRSQLTLHFQLREHHIYRRRSFSCDTDHTTPGRTEHLCSIRSVDPALLCTCRLALLRDALLAKAVCKLRLSFNTSESLTEVHHAALCLDTDSASVLRSAGHLQVTTPQDLALLFPGEGWLGGIVCSCGRALANPVAHSAT